MLLPNQKRGDEEGEGYECDENQRVEEYNAVGTQREGWLGGVGGELIFVATSKV